MSPSSLKLASGISASMFTLLAGRKGKGRKARKGHLQLSTTPLRNSWKSWSSFPVTTYWPEVNHMIISSCRVPLFWEAICQAILVFYYTEGSREQLKQLQFLQELVVRMCFGGWVTFVRFIHAEYYMLAHSFSLLYIISFCDYLTTSLSGLLFMLFFLSFWDGEKRVYRSNAMNALVCLLVHTYEYFCMAPTGEWNC